MIIIILIDVCLNCLDHRECDHILISARIRWYRQHPVILHIIHNVMIWQFSRYILYRVFCPAIGVLDWCRSIGLIQEYRADIGVLDRYTIIGLRWENRTDKKYQAGVVHLILN